MEVPVAENKYGVQFGGSWRYGRQPGMTNDPDGLTVLRYTNPEAVEVYEWLTTGRGTQRHIAARRNRGGLSPNESEP